MLLGLPCNLGGKLLAGYQELHRNNYAVFAGAVASVIGLALGICLACLDAGAVRDVGGMPDLRQPR